MGKLIELDKSMEILQNWEAITYNCNTIEESFAMLANEVSSLPQIDIVSEIEKMIEEYENEQKRISKGSSLHYDLSMYIKTLQGLLQKFKS